MLTIRARQSPPVAAYPCSMDVRHARLTILAAVTAGCALAACDDSESQPPAEHAETSVHNAYIVPAYDTSCVLQIDAPAQLSFTAANTSSTTTETLKKISTPAASAVTITAPIGALHMQPRSVIAAGQPIENTDQPAAPDAPFTATLRGLDTIVGPAQSIPVTFEFERAGTITVDVAVDACPTQTNP